LAIQIFNLLKSLSNNDGPEFVQCVFAGVDIDEQQKLLKQTPKYLIGTPNRLLELYEKKAYDINRLQTLVIDEVDRIVLPLSRYSTVKKTFNKKIHPTPGEDLIRLIVQTKSKNIAQVTESEQEKDRSMDVPLQVVVSSATVNNPLKRILTNAPRSWMKKPVIVDLNSSPPKEVTHIGYYFDPTFNYLPVSKQMSHGKVFKDDSIVTEETLAETLASLFRFHDVKRAMVFCSSNTSVQKLVDSLNFVGVKSDKMFNMHDYTLKIEDHKPFKKLLEGKVDCIVATEFEARGLDVPDVSHVFMVGMTTPQSYQHVTGRTGRFGKKGVAITLLPSAKEAPKYLDMIAKLGIETTEPDASI
jgi:superfamily II DNA/RNA helicase